MPPLSPSSAGQLLQRRALQCSFSSVFHLKNGGGMNPKDAKFAEDVFTGVVGVPIVLIALTGIYLSHFPSESSSKHTQ
eukprot:CAMPEP_0198143338 /NCGR_PEP_ID=MMETSP1443-20131203/6547_1 /TAXON_ID=186043 /ORGANISM="Entomoneis sp., Strain CCMP2396" /LENGTH=77 /DNA_ID=CAMNT_0043806559 /DNA_START=30 /DNA_END=263 /DNA_ORIENTATION=+